MYKCVFTRTTCIYVTHFLDYVQILQNFVEINYRKLRSDSSQNLKKGVNMNMLYIDQSVYEIQENSKE